MISSIYMIIGMSLIILGIFIGAYVENNKWKKVVKIIVGVMVIAGIICVIISNILHEDDDKYDPRVGYDTTYVTTTPKGSFV